MNIGKRISLRPINIGNIENVVTYEYVDRCSLVLLLLRNMISTFPLWHSKNKFHIPQFPINVEK